MRCMSLFCGLLLAASAAPVMAAPVNMHRVWANGDCAPPLVETIDVPRGQITMHLLIKGWSPAAYAGIPYWMSFQRYEPEANGYTGWNASLLGAADNMRIRGVSSVRNPYEPKAGGQLELTEVDEVILPFRMQVQITGPTWHSGDGACHQGAMETFLTVDPEASAAPTGASWAGQWSGNMSLTQNGSNVSGTSSDGDIVGTAQGAEFNGYWITTSSRYKCSIARNGSWYWGRLHWALTTDGKHFVGSSSYCDADPAGGTAWNGDRTGGPVQPPQPPVVSHGDETGTAGAFGGQWTSNWGAMSLGLSGTGLSGSFEHANGKISGQASGDSASGYWMQDTAGQRCDTARNGTYYWGRFNWTLAADGRSFNGLWGYCDAAPDSGWTATRVGGVSSAKTYRQPPQPPVSHHQTQSGDQGYAAGESPSSGQESGRDHGQNGRRGDHHGSYGASQTETQLYDNWNTAGCGFTDTATLTLDAPAHVSRVALWFNWRQGESGVGYTVTSNGRNVGGGTLTRGDCDPYQSTWCEARDTPDTDLDAGGYDFRVDRGAVCQNSGSGGAGFIKAWGYETGGRGRR
ncbi:MAG: hypothetical protein ACHP84_18180 [Caulobacterales bacterium]